MSVPVIGLQSSLELDEEDIEAIAQRVAKLLQPPPPDVGWVRVEVVCRRFGVSRTWAYAHVNELGGHPTRNRPQGQATVDLNRCGEAILAMARPALSGTGGKPRRTRARTAMPDSMELIGGRSGR